MSDYTWDTYDAPDTPPERCECGRRYNAPGHRIPCEEEPVTSRRPAFVWWIARRDAPPLGPWASEELATAVAAKCDGRVFKKEGAHA